LLQQDNRCFFQTLFAFMTAIGEKQLFGACLKKPDILQAGTKVLWVMFYVFKPAIA